MPRKPNPRKADPWANVRARANHTGGAPIAHVEESREIICIHCGRKGWQRTLPTGNWSPSCCPKCGSGVLYVVIRDGHVLSCGEMCGDGRPPEPALCGYFAANYK